MSLKNQPIPAIPEQTYRIARAAFPKGNPWVRLRDELGVIYQNEEFASLFSHTGQPAIEPWRVAMVSVMQYAEGLTDRQASEAVRSRIDWKYALSLELDDAGFDFSVLSEFRSRLIEGEAEEQMLDGLLKVCEQKKLLGGKRGKQRTDSTHVMAAVRVLNRLETVIETMRHALEALSELAPQWLLSEVRPGWTERYSRRMEEYRLPKNEQERSHLAKVVGEDGEQLLDSIYSKESPPLLREIEAVQTLRRVWVQQYCQTGKGIKWRGKDDGLPPAHLGLHSPHDSDARYSKKRSEEWVGYKAHLTETCDEGRPRLIVEAETTTAPVTDNQVVEGLHNKLRAKKLLPKRHFVDAGYVDAALIVSSKKLHKIDLCGPTLADTSWQGRAGKGFAASDFSFDWDNRQTSCPESRQSSSWHDAIDNRGNAKVQIKFSRLDCRPCQRRIDCTTTERRILTVLPREEFEALTEARRRERTPEWKEEYKRRAGVEGTLSQAVRNNGLRRARYVGLAKMHLQTLLTAVAINLSRIASWLSGVPLTKTRITTFADLTQTKAIMC